MSFDRLLKKISPRLKGMAISHNGHSTFFNEEDLYQEICIYLWKNYKDGMPGGVNEAYIIRGCKFHLLNYLRKEREKARMRSLDEPLNEEGDTLKDILPDNQRIIENYLDNRITIEEIKNNGITRTEKEVFSLLLEGYTSREIGRKLDISHVMVLKHKQNIIRKWQKNR